MASEEDDLFGTDLDLTAADLMVIDRRCAISRATPKLSRLDTIHHILKDTFQLSDFRPKACYLLVLCLGFLFIEY